MKEQGGLSVGLGVMAWSFLMIMLSGLVLFSTSLPIPVVAIWAGVPTVRALLMGSSGSSSSRERLRLAMMSLPFVVVVTGLAACLLRPICGCGSPVC